MLRRTSEHTNAGYALVELVAVVVVIAVAASLVVPAIERGRSNARQIQCLNNLHQLSMAIHYYEQDRGVFPPGVVNPTGPIDQTRYDLHIGLLTQILPQVEQLAVSGEIHPEVSVYSPANQTARRCRISSFVCPADPVAKRLGPIGLSSYAGCHHDMEAPIDIDNHGVFFLNSHVSYDAITDGTGNTIFLGEKVTRAFDLGWMSGTRSTLRNTGHRINTNEDDSLKKPPGRSPWFVGGFGSGHKGGANFAFGDGSVRFLSQTIDLELYRHLGRRDDGELVGGDAF